MSWASHAIAALRDGRPVVVHPPGNSMQPVIAHRQACTIEPLGERTPKAGDIVLCRVGRSDYLHRVIAVQRDRYQIGNNHGHINGKIARESIYGIFVGVGADHQR